MPKFYSVDAIRMDVFIKNWIFGHGAKVSPHDLYYGRTLNLVHLRVFSNIAYVHVSNEKQGKLNSKAGKCILVDYLDEQKGYKYYKPEPNKSRSVKMSRSIGRHLGTCPRL